MDKGPVTFAEDHKRIHWPADVFFLLFRLIPSCLKKIYYTQKNILNSSTEMSMGGKGGGAKEWSHRLQLNA